MNEDGTRLRIWTTRPLQNGVLSIPLYLVLKGVAEPGFPVIEYEVLFEVIDAPTTRTVAIVKWDVEHVDVTSIQYLKIGMIDVSHPLWDRVMITYFHRLIHEMNRVKGNVVSFWVADAAAWFATRLSAKDAAILTEAFAPFASPRKSGPNAVWVRRE